MYVLEKDNVGKRRIWIYLKENGKNLINHTLEDIHVGMFFFCFMAISFSLLLSIFLDQLLFSFLVHIELQTLGTLGFG